MATEIVKIGESEAAVSYRIQGKTVDSLPEVYFAMALEKLGYRYEYQASFFGQFFGKRGLSIDFRVFTLPLETFVFIDGAWYHSSPGTGERDKFERAALFNKTRKFARKPVSIPASTCTNPDDAFAAAKKALGN